MPGPSEPSPRGRLDPVLAAGQADPEAAQAARDHMVERIYQRAAEVTAVAQTGSGPGRPLGARLDDILTSRRWGIPVMILLLGTVFWITLVGAQYPAQLLGELLTAAQRWLSAVSLEAGMPAWLHGPLVLGMLGGLAWVVSVMLPPMAIFFPLFTLLEDLGYLPRVAFNLDRLFRQAGAHGKQSLTMAMGFGCNAAGVISCRVINSPRERLIAILTNSFVPCNGRFPMLIALSAIFFGGAGAHGNHALGALIATGVVVALVVTGILVTLVVSGGLSRTILRGVPSAFVLELPPYRRPQLGRIIVRSILDRTAFVLGRAIVVAAPAGILVWVLGNTSLAGQTLLAHVGQALGPLGRLMGLDGFVLASFVLGLPANEIVIPVLLMSYLGAGEMVSLDGLPALRAVLVANGWTGLTALCAMLFSLLHFPCGTTLLTIWRETGSRRWTTFAALMPTAIGILACILVAAVGRGLAGP